MSVLKRIPVVGGLAYIERVQRLASAFRATLQPDRGNPYFRHAIQVLVNGEKVGYVAPEVSTHYVDALVAHAGEPVTCAGRRAGPNDHQTSGVELLLDFSELPVTPAPEPAP